MVSTTSMLTDSLPLIHPSLAANKLAMNIIADKKRKNDIASEGSNTRRRLAPLFKLSWSGAAKG